MLTFIFLVLASAMFVSGILWSLSVIFFFIKWGLIIFIAYALYKTLLG